MPPDCRLYPFSVCNQGHTSQAQADTNFLAGFMPPAVFLFS
uniref:Uncharacterized protein n=1 Tax=Zea mays TaxID=4577 RepID=C4IZ49_MAIZE|nr:unknown [Zea mays]